MIPEKASQAAGRAEPHVLVVDDDIETRYVLAARLRASGFIVSEASDAEEATQLLACSLTFHAVVTDFEMPGTMNGMALAEHIRANYPGIQVTVVSGMNLRDDAQRRGLTFFQKPYVFESLADTLKRR